MNACGVDCAECPSFGSECRGCAAEQGQVYWTAFMGEHICPLYACAQKKGMKDCGHCGDVPCGIWLSLHAIRPFPKRRFRLPFRRGCGGSGAEGGVRRPGGAIPAGDGL